MTGALGYLTETTCVLLTPALLQPPGGGKGRHFPYIDIIESLLKNRFVGRHGTAQQNQNSVYSLCRNTGTK